MQQIVESGLNKICSDGCSSVSPIWMLAVFRMDNLIGDLPM